MDLQTYITRDGVDVFRVWLARLRDPLAKMSIRRRLDRIKVDNFGQVRPLRKGVWEIKIDVGAGYRVYYAQAGQTIILLLCGGDKGSQDDDIARAVAYWVDFQERERRQ
jgi:putative addiction module killer protein